MISDYFVLTTPRSTHAPIPNNSPRGQSQPKRDIASIQEQICQNWNRSILDCTIQDKTGHACLRRHVCLLCQKEIHKTSACPTRSSSWLATKSKHYRASQTSTILSTTISQSQIRSLVTSLSPTNQTLSLTHPSLTHQTLSLTHSSLTRPSATSNFKNPTSRKTRSIPIIGKTRILDTISRTPGIISRTLGTIPHPLDDKSICRPRRIFSALGKTRTLGTISRIPDTIPRTLDTISHPLDDTSICRPRRISLQSLVPLDHMSSKHDNAFRRLKHRL